MIKNDSLSGYGQLALHLVLALMLSGLSACATPPNAETTDTPSADKPKTEQPESTAADATQPEGTDQTEAPAQLAAAAQPEANDKEPEMKPVETQPVRIDVSCKSEPYSQYEQQARDSIGKGLNATTEGIYGVGFRNLQEHKKWSETHNALFKAVNQACTTLNQCAQQHPKDKTTQCASQAKQFSEWQNLAAEFAKKAKLSETTQPPKLCSFTPDLDDAAHCFHGLADNVDKTCNTPACKEASDCWRGIGFLDAAINQAASACGFARQPLTECRGYLTVTQRRKDKFERCTEMQKALQVPILPVL